jgi:hypothetical protein
MQWYGKQRIQVRDQSCKY